MALNDIRVPKENAQATFDEIALAPADIGAVASNDARLTDARTPLSHTHGNLTNAGAIGTTSGLPVKTGTSGVLEAGAFGTAAGQFAEGNHTHTAADISSGVLDLARQKIVELVPCDDDPANELDVSAYEQNGNIVAHFNLRADAEDPQIAVLLPDLASTAIGEVTLRVNRGGGQSLEFTSVFIEVFDEADEQIFGTSEGTLEVDADEELTFRWNNGRWDLDLRPNPLATTTAVSIFKPNASGTLALTEDFAAPPAIGSTTPAAGTFTTLAANNGTVTASAPVLNLAQTWNAGAVTFTGLLLNITATANSTSSNYFAIQRDGTTHFAVVANTGVTPMINIGGGVYTTRIRGRTAAGVGLNFDGVVGIATTLQFGVIGTFGGDVSLRREAANTLAQVNVANPQTFRLYTTIGGTGNVDFERLFLKGQTGAAFQIGTEAGGTGSARALEFQTDGVTRMTLGSAGEIGFFGAAAAAQPAAIADATDAATTQDRLNDLLARLRTLGLIAT
jgi:hypothetical protein